MGKLYDSFKSYFENTPKEVIDRDWQELEYLNEIGPDVIEYAQKFYGYISSSEHYYSGVLNDLGLCDVEALDDLETYDIHASNKLKTEFASPHQIEMGKFPEYCLAA